MRAEHRSDRPFYRHPLGQLRRVQLPSVGGLDAPAPVLRELHAQATHLRCRGGDRQRAPQVEVGVDALLFAHVEDSCHRTDELAL